MTLTTGGTMAEVIYGETYKYLGVAQLLGAKPTKTKNWIRREYLVRLRKTWGSNLNANNMGGGGGGGGSSPVRIIKRHIGGRTTYPEAEGERCRLNGHRQSGGE